MAKKPTVGGTNVKPGGPVGPALPPWNAPPTPNGPYLTDPKAGGKAK
jgi:hypothetical protein